MKSTLNLIFLLILSVSLEAQDITIGQVFNYEIGDEFHYRAANRPPNATRFVVKNKYLSQQSDTIFYLVKYDAYSSEVVMSPTPHLEYSIGSWMDTLSYTSLDSSITTLLNLTEVDNCDQVEDSIIESPPYCQRKVYQYSACFQCCFEGRQYEAIYGEGIGQAYGYHSFPAENYSTDSRLFYYKKGSKSCGTPDKSNYTVVQEKYLQHILISPNPAHDFINVAGFTGDMSVTLRNMVGEVIQQEVLKSEGRVSLTAIPSGIYLLELKVKDQSKVLKVLID